VDRHFPHVHPPPRDRFQGDLGAQCPGLRIEIPEHFRVGIAAVVEPGDDRVRRRLQQKAIEGIADLKRKRAAQLQRVEDPLEPQERESGDPHRLPFVNAEGDVGVSRRADDARVHHRRHVAALAVQQQQPHDVAPEFQLIEVPFLAQPEPADERIRRKPARTGRRNRAAQRVIV